MRQTQRFDWAAVSTGAPEPLAAGLYRARINKFEVQETKAKDKKMINLTLEIYENESGEKMTRTVFDRLVFTQKALFRVAFIHNALGGDDVIGSLPEDDEDDSLKAYGKQLQKGAAGGVWVKLDQETYTDTKSGEERVRNTVERYLSDKAVKEAASDSSSNGIATGDDAPMIIRRRSAEAQAS